jgi:hypothetical protein
MATGYTRQSAADIIPGAQITSGPLNSEFNQLRDAFDSIIGHDHAGLTGRGPKLDTAVSLTGGTWTFSLTPSVNDGAALGTALLSWSDLFLASGSVINWNAGDVTLTHAANKLTFAGATSGYQFDAIIAPSANDGSALGSTALMWSDLFLAAGGVINWNNGAYTITESTGGLTFSGGSTNTIFQSSFNGAGTNFFLRNITRNTVNDTINLRFNLLDSLSTDQEYARITTSIVSNTSAAEVGRLTLGVTSAGALTNYVRLDPNGWSPNGNDIAALGTATVSWSDLFLASGAVINFNNGDVTITHSADTLTFAGAASDIIFNSTLGSNSTVNLGDTGKEFGSIFLATAGVVNFGTQGYVGNITGTNMFVQGDAAANFLLLQTTFNAAATSVTLYNAARATINDNLALTFRMLNSSSTPKDYAFIRGQISSPTAAAEAGVVVMGVMNAGVSTSYLVLTSGVFRPNTNDLVSLGVSGTAWSDLFLASGAVINFSAADVTITHSANTLTIAGGNLAMNGILTASSGTATPAGGSSAAHIGLGTTANLGIYYGSGAPTVSAAKGSLYMRSDGSSTVTRAYINTDGATTWTAITTVA